MMNLRKSLINQPLLKNIIKNNLFPAKISLIVFWGFFILSLITADGTGIGQICIAIFAISAVVLTTLYPPLIQSYLIDKTKSSIIKSIPLSTGCIWFTNYLAGYLIVLVTLLIEGIGVIFVDVIRSYFSIFTGSSLPRLILMIFVLLFIYYTMTFLISSMAGNRLSQVVFSIVAYSLPCVLLLSFTLFTSYMVPGSISEIENYYMNLVFPLVAGMNYISYGDPTVFMHILTALVFLALSFYVYKNRDDEYIGEPLVFRKLGIVLKAGIVLIVTVLVFYLILLFSYIDITFGIKGLSILLMIYLVIGIITAVFIEIIFKGDHIYRSLLIYLPVLVVFFGINYVIANNKYNNVVNKIYDMQDTEAVIYIYNEENEFTLSLSLEHKNINDLVRYLNNNRDCIHYEINNSADLVSFDIYTNNENYNNILNYRLDQKWFIDYFNQDNNFLNNYNENYKDEKYINVYSSKYNLYLNAQDIQQLYQLADDQKLKVDDFFEKEMINLYGASENDYLLKLNDQIDAFFQSEELIKQTEFIEHCDSFIDNIEYSVEANNDIVKFIKDKSALKEITSIYNDNKRLIDFDNNYALYNIMISAVDADKNNKIDLEVRMEKDANNDVFISSIRKVGE